MSASGAIRGVVMAGLGYFVRVVFILAVVLAVVVVLMKEEFKRWI